MKATSELPAQNLREIHTSPDGNTVVVINDEKSHLHEGVEERILEVLSKTDLSEIEPTASGTLIIHSETEIPMPCYCVEVKEGDQVVLAYRESREYTSPVILNGKPDLSNEITVVLKPEETADPAIYPNQIVLRVATAYIGPTAPLEPNYPTIKDRTANVKDIEASLAFWLSPDGSWKHAMVPEEGEEIRIVD